MGDVLPDRIPPGPATIISNLTEDQFVDYLKKGYIDYNVDGHEVYFTEHNLINLLCHMWDPEDRPSTLLDLPEYCGLESNYPDICDEAERSINEERIRKTVLEHCAEESHELCDVCGKKDVHSKGICRKHYDKVRYHFDTISDETIEEFKREIAESTGWSSNYSNCKSCGTTNKPHHARGYCYPCYRKHEFKGEAVKT